MNNLETGAMANMDTNLSIYSINVALVVQSADPHKRYQNFSVVSSIYIF